jgi:phosphatidate cytidylyltransferase
MRHITHNQSFQALQNADDLLSGVLAGAVMGAFFLAARRGQYEAALGSLGCLCLGLFYLSFLPSFVLKIRHLGENGLPGGPNWNDFGQKMVIATIVVAKGCDIFAYLVGRVVGRHKAFPHLSPGKTIEGVAAGLGGSLGLAFLLRWSVLGVLPESHFSVTATCIFGLVIGLSGMMGDLAESLLKRSAGVKDAGQTIPGFGGILDVIDSLTIAGPVAYFLIPVII